MYDFNDPPAATPSEKQTEPLEAPLCSGTGQWHSPNNSVNPQDYTTVTLSSIAAMLPNPPSADKPNAQWVIFSELPSRVHAEQRQNGRFYALWSDLDDMGGLTFDDVIERADGCLLDFWAYTTKSAAFLNQKARIIVPLSEPIDGRRFVVLQKILNDKLEENGIKPDRATERAGQVCYLPNRGEFYRCHIENSAGPMPVDAWADEEKAEQDRIDAAKREAQARHEQAIVKATQRMQTGCKSPIDAYNAEFSLETELERYGYLRQGRRWLSPNSGSRAAGVSLTADGRKWLSTHGSDAAIGTPTANGTMGDAFDLFVYYEHRGDRNAAIRAAGQMFGLNGQQEQPAPSAQEHIDTASSKKAEAAKTPFSLNAFALNGLAAKMEAQMREDQFIMGRLAIRGQSTAIYAQFNMGKTLLSLHLLIERIKAGELNAADVFYINADDTYKGLVYKLKAG